jgi:hypothetical protein
MLEQRCDCAVRARSGFDSYEESRARAIPVDTELSTLRRVGNLLW